MDTNERINKPRVAVASGATRREAVRNALELVSDDISARVKGSVLVKPNFLSSTNPLASTQAEAVVPVIEFLKKDNADSIIIGEGAARSTVTAFRNFGYEELSKKYNVKLIDLNRDNFANEFEIVTQTRGTQIIRYGDITAGADTIISVAVAKTHDFATVTFSLKNMMGCLRRIYRPRMHGVKLGLIIESAGEIMWNILDSYPAGMKLATGIVFGALHLSRYFQKKKHHGAMPGYISQVRALSENIVRLGRVLMPDIAVIDAFDVMEGEGPGGGKPVRMGVAVAGTDAVACDAVMAYMMGFEPLSIGYMSMANDCGIGCADLQDIEIVGEDPSVHVRHVKPHSNYPLQMKWKEAW